LHIKWVAFDNGERFPMLVNRAEGMLLFYHAVYSISMRRASGASSATMSRDLQAIMHMYVWAQANGFNIEERFANGDFLSIHEIDNLAETTGSGKSEFCRMFTHGLSVFSLSRMPFLIL